MSSQAQTKAEDGQQEQSEDTYGERFVAMVKKEYDAQLSDTLNWGDYEKTLAQHTFLKVDEALREAEKKRQSSDRGKGKTPYVWKNVNLEKLALNAVHRVGLGLDPILPNHVHPVFYWNSREGKYDCALQLGYAGKDWCARTMALDEPLDIVYHLVHANDHFKPLPRAQGRPGDTYEFEIKNPFNRGLVVGGFGYVMYDDERKNRLFLVPKEEFEKAKKNAGTQDFWNTQEDRMQYKTVVNRVADRVPIDPRKVNSRSYVFVNEQELGGAEADMDDEMAEHANQGEVIDITPAEEEAPDSDDAAACDDQPADAGEDAAEGPGF